MKTKKLMIPIDFESIAKEHGITRGTIVYYELVQNWVIPDHDSDIWGPDFLISVNAPYSKGQIIDGKFIKNVTIKNNHWCVSYQEYNPARTRFN